MLESRPDTLLELVIGRKPITPAQKNPFRAIFWKKKLFKYVSFIVDKSAEIGRIFYIEYASESSGSDALTDALFIYKRMKIPSRMR